MTAAQRMTLGLVRIYQVAISPWLGPHCRFYPSCSAYCAEAVSRFGVARGLWLTGKRILKCHPFHPGGVDFVPEAAGTRAGGIVRGRTS